MNWRVELDQVESYLSATFSQPVCSNSVNGFFILKNDDQDTSHQSWSCSSNFLADRLPWSTKAMYSVEIDRSRRLLVITASGCVTGEEVKAAAKMTRDLIKNSEPGLRALTDLRLLASMEPAAAAHIAEIMKALQDKGLISVTRVVPDPRKDIGYNILSQFHYDSRVKIYVFETLADAILSLAEDPES